MSSRRSRDKAYGDLIAGLLDVRHDPATERFDAELAAAEADGRLDPQTAKVLRWWQREALRSLVEHARVVVPPTLMALEDAQQGASLDAEESSQSWARAGSDDLGGADIGSSQLTAPLLAASSVTAPSVDVSVGGTRGPAHVSVGSASSDDVVLPPTDLSEHRRRMLVAGLTRVPREP